MRLVRTIGIVLCAVFSLVSCAALEKAVESPIMVDEGSVLFQYYDPSARTVQVAGDWTGNNWLEGDEGKGEVLIGLMHQKRGVWSLKVRLEPGRYKYRFYINERIWVLDPSNPRIVNDGMGGKANLLIVP
jgi:1,4-alpha-glucan branching enzyme